MSGIKYQRARKGPRVLPQLSGLARAIEIGVVKLVDRRKRDLVRT